MHQSAPFESHHRRYDHWFDRHAPVYHSELLAVRAMFPWQGLGVSIGVGTGRFAAPLGVQVGIDPSQAMLGYAAGRGIDAVRAVAEALPFAANLFDRALCVTTICFVDDPVVMLKEIHRVLKPGGVLVLGFIDRSSDLGQRYLAHRNEHVFYQTATFFSAIEVQELLNGTGFTGQVWGQTLSQELKETQEIEHLRSGYGQGAFVVVRASRA